MSKQQNKISTFDFTIFLRNKDGEQLTIIDDYNIINHSQLLLSLFNNKEQIKNYAFQLESCPKSKALHFQGRFTLRKQDRLTAINKLFINKFNINDLHYGNLSITSNENKGNNFYVLKDSSSVSDKYKWSDKIEVITIPNYIKKITSLYPYQENIKTLLNMINDRNIYIIYDRIGNNGKNTTAQFFHYNGINNTVEIPYMDTTKSLLEMAYALTPQDTNNKNCCSKHMNYFFNLPKCVKIQDMPQLLTAIEIIKDGKVFDTRNKFKYITLMDKPNIFITLNKLPKLNLLSIDRLKIFSIDDKKLISYIPSIDDFNNDSFDYEIYREQYNKFIKTVNNPICNFNLDKIPELNKIEYDF